MMNSRLIPSLSCLLLCLTLLVGCNLASAPSSASTTPDASTPLSPTSTTESVIQVSQLQQTPAPTQSRELHSIQTPTDLPATHTPTVTPAPLFVCAAQPDQNATRHEVIATVDYAEKSVLVSQQIHYTNLTARTLTEIVLRIDSNSYQRGLLFGTLRLLNQDAEYTLERNRLTVMLPVPLEAGCGVTLDFSYLLTPPQIGTGLAAFKGYYGYSPRQLNLAHWLATPAPIIDGDWLVHEPREIGEQHVLEQADWDVLINVENAASSLLVAAPGNVTKTDDMQWRIQLDDARDVSVSLSENFRVTQASTQSGVEVAVYTFGDALIASGTGYLDGGEHVLRESVKAMQQYESLFGPYPYERMVVVQGDFPDGMEFSGLVFVSTAWFRGFAGGVDNFLTVITVHEVSHQWWYLRVGNDAALTPWLDEALATYSEYIYYEEFHPDLKNWWWSFRVGWYDPQGDVDSTVYEFGSAREYINAVYLRGVQMLHNLREDIGTQAFFDLLAAYASEGDGRIASAETFWRLLTPEQWEISRETRGQFLREPDMLRD